MKSLGSIFIYPLIGTFIVCGIVMWGIGIPIATMMTSMNAWLASMAGSGKIALDAILGGMTAFDMGGPINKVATLFAQTQVDTQPWLMGGVGIAICTPPLGMALATFLSPKKYTKDEKEAGKATAIMGVRIKVETQGANGIVNRITQKDIENAKVIIFAHDVAIKEPQRFKNIKILDVKTKVAIQDPKKLIEESLQ